MADIARPDYGVVWANAGEKIAPELGKMNSGWVREMMPFQYENWLQARQDDALTYILQKGVAEYSATQDYIANKSLVFYQGVVYMALKNSTNVLPTVKANWKRFSTISNNDGVVSIAGGGTGATTQAGARTALGLGSAALLDAALVVQKDANGDFSAGTITATINGVASSANRLATARSITLSGAVTSTASLFDGSSNIVIVSTSVDATKLSGQVPVANLDAAVAKTSATGSVITPAGTTAQRDASPKEGYLRYNTNSKLPEFWNGTAWITQNGTDLAGLIGTSADQISTNAMLDARNVNGANITGQVPAASLTAAVIKTAATRSAVLPAGTTAQRDPTPLLGYTRYNTEIKDIEVYDGAVWRSPSPTAIVSGTDLNTMTIEGEYFAATTGIVNTITNKPPVTGAFGLSVINIGGVNTPTTPRRMQTIRQAQGVSATKLPTYTRWSDSGNWSPWVLEESNAFQIIYPNGGTASSPATASINSRYVSPNPFPGSSVMCVAEIQVGGKWGIAGWLYVASGGQGVIASEFDGSIITQTGAVGISHAGNLIGQPNPAITSSINTAPVRVKVWKIGV